MAYPFSIAVITALIVAASSGCSAQSALPSSPEIDMAQRAVSAGFAHPASAYFKDQKVVSIVRTQGSRATVVCGEVNRRGRDQSVTGGWRPFYYVVSYDPAATFAVTPTFTDPDSTRKRVAPPQYRPGDYGVLYGDDDDNVVDGPEADAFMKHWIKFCMDRAGPIDEWTLQERGRPQP